MKTVSMQKLLLFVLYVLCTVYSLQKSFWTGFALSHGSFGSFSCGGFLKCGYPQIILFPIGCSIINTSNLGYLHFRKRPFYSVHLGDIREGTLVLTQRQPERVQDRWQFRRSFVTWDCPKICAKMGTQKKTLDHTIQWQEVYPRYVVLSNPRCEPWCWKIYLHNWASFEVDVGTYSSTMEYLGIVTRWCPPQLQVGL